jgi:predicted nucleic acid-binding protein
MIDTNIVIDLFRKNANAVAWYASVQNLKWSITPIVWMEAAQGALNKRELAVIIAFLMQYTIEHPTVNDNYWAMTQITQFALSHGLQLPDAMIASVAVGLGIPLYTRNLKHFSFLPGLQVIRPY